MNEAIINQTGQQIDPTPLIEGRLNDSVTIVCTSAVPGEAVNNILSIYRPFQGIFESFEMDNRLERVNDVSNSTYTFGPLMESDNGIVFRCTSSGQSSVNSTVSIGKCLYYFLYHCIVV